MKEIGSEFNLDLFYCIRKKKKLQKGLYLSTGRDSLTYIINAFNLKNKEILLPAYLDDAVISPFKKNNVKIRLYAVNKDLSADINNIKSKITKATKAVLIIHYFGFLQNTAQLKRLCKKNNLFLIQDFAQTLQINSNSDAAFNSYRKLLPVPDGSLLLIKSNKVRLRKSLNHCLFVKFKYLSLLLKTIYLKTRLLPGYFFKTSFDRAEQYIEKYPKPAKISCLAAGILRRINFDKIAGIRRENYEFLLKNLKNKGIIPLYKNLPNNACPLCFPIIAKNRDKIKNKLIKNKVYPPVHWLLPKEINKSAFPLSHKISSSLLSIPIDQRYNKKDMQRIIKCLS